MNICMYVCNLLFSLQLVWLGINAFLFVHFYMAFLVDRFYYSRVILGVRLVVVHINTNVSFKPINSNMYPFFVQKRLMTTVGKYLLFASKILDPTYTKFPNFNMNLTFLNM